MKVADKCRISLDWIYRGDGQGPLEADAGGGEAAIPAETPSEDLAADDKGLTIVEAKRQLARSLGIAPSNIKITIEA